MTNYNPICFLTHLVEKNKNNSFQLSVRKFNEELDDIHDALYSQRYYIGFGFNDFVDACVTKFPEWIKADVENLVVYVNVDNDFVRTLKDYLKIFILPWNDIQL